MRGHRVKKMKGQREAPSPSPSKIIVGLRAFPFTSAIFHSLGDHAKLYLRRFPSLITRFASATGVVLSPNQYSQLVLF